MNTTDETEEGGENNEDINASMVLSEGEDGLSEKIEAVADESDTAVEGMGD